MGAVVVHRAPKVPIRAQRKVYGPPKKGWWMPPHPDTRLRAGHRLYSVALKDVLDLEVMPLTRFAPECELVTNYKACDTNA